ncbi:MAG TPA: hypothetical protein VNO31_13040 [Umezawaea sp.]|nr:hypothetical protein [Umezawaea sp.]
MSITTGYTDTFGRTVAGGLGTATSGQVYSINASASQFSVAPNVATIAMNAAGNFYGYIDNLTQDVDITGQVALTAIPATNLATVGFVAKWASTSNYYIGTMMVATGGAISLRFSKVIGGGLSTIATISTGLTYVANTFYNLRFSARWSQALQTNVLQLKLWALNTDQPGGWMAVTTDSGLTNYTAGTSVGFLGRDESTVSGSVSAKIQNVATMSNHLPIPATTDPMCNDPAITYPDQTALESLADAVDTAMTALDPLVALAGLFPRVRISSTNQQITNSSAFLPPFQAVEFNVGTPTDLGLDATSIYLGVGIWMVTYELALSPAASDWLWAQINGPANANIVSMRSNPAHTGADAGGTVHLTAPVIVTDPTTPTRCSIALTLNNTAATYVATYMALSAIKISDYFA